MLSYFEDPLIRQQLFATKSSSNVIAEGANLVKASLPLLSLSQLTCTDPISEEGALNWFLACDMIRRNVVRCYFLPSDNEECSSRGMKNDCFIACSTVRLMNIPFVSGREELVLDIANSLSALTLPHLAGKITLRLSCCPKQLESFLVESLPLELKISPKDYTHVLMVVEEQGERARFRWSLVVKDWLYLQPSDEPSTHPDSVAHAVNKLEEAMTISRAIFPSPDSQTGYQFQTAIDLGAAPGAWTGHLADKGAFVIAVDPAVLDPRILEKNGVVHLRMRSEDAGDQIIALLKERGMKGKADLLVSDMNVHPADAAGLVSTLLPYVRAGGLLIFTLKFHGKGQSQGKRDEAERQLNAAFGPWIDSGRVFTLLSNTMFEQTYIGRLKVSSCSG